MSRTVTFRSRSITREAKCYESHPQRQQYTIIQECEPKNGDLRRRGKKRIKKSSTVTEEVFSVEAILDSKVDEKGCTLYKTRWQGYGPDDDTWEPLKNVVETGHVDRFVRRQRIKTMSHGKPGVAIIEYIDGERSLVDLTKETFRLSTDESQNMSQNLSGKDFSIVRQGAKLELFWPYVGIYFPCEVITWNPLKDKQSD